MKKIPVFFFSSLLFLSCGSNQKKLHNPISSPIYINLVESLNGFSSAYTEDGHTIIYETDSANNFIVYYAKFDDNAGKKGYDRIKDKAVRIETDSSMNMLTSFVSVNGGASFQIDDKGDYQVYYFDEQMNGNNVLLHEICMKEHSEGIKNPESKIKRIIYLLAVAHDVAKKINERNIGGWNYIVSALEPSQNLLNYDVLKSDTVYDPIIKEHINRIMNSTEGLTQYYNLLKEEQRRK